ncbi:MAG: DUF971 domain-containing protein [Candidatus Wallbacteria bacterium]|nr:DUF971 domain-containing protein [Candidatus Wallbacteria bacterium]MBI4865443.1 DUF971 domain-containing protein [Candidatus Wallbacteria bacterium]
MAELSLPVAIGPIAIFRKGPAELLIRWVDGHEAVFSFRHLRDKCPCAACGSKPSHGPKPAAPGGLPMMPVLVKGAEGPADLVSLAPVGRYAVSFTFGDGHSSGIYSFEYLRGICPCPACEARRREG